jgi:hypothetical protein
MAPKKVAAVLISVLLFLSYAHCVKTDKVRNSLGVTISLDNPNTYMFGKISNIVLHDCDVDEPCTTVEFHGWATPLVVPAESITFCGDLSNMSFSPDWQVWTYRKAGTRIYNGIVCHNLVSITRVEIQQ